MKTKLLALALFAATAGSIALYPLTQSQATAIPVQTAPQQPQEQPQEQPPVSPIGQPAKKRPKVDVVFVLDTTGSMSGLIQAAKENIWSIASNMASANTSPDIRLGLVAFRDRGDDYVTRVIDLSGDLDSIYATLMDFSADGGGDGPESVNQALNDAVNRVSWSQDKDSYKVIFLVGDAPPHMDYQDEMKYPDVIKAASAKGIIVNTIQAGNDPETRQEWMQIAKLNQGEYFQVEQSGNAVAVATPFDEQIAALSRSLDETRLFYGDEAKQKAMHLKEEATDKLHAEGSVASRAKRAAFNASPSGAGNFLGDSELISDVASGKVDIQTLAPAQLPEPLRALKKDEQIKVIEEKASQRAELSGQIEALSRQRKDFIAKELAEGDSEKSSLDYQIFNAVKAQAAEKGLSYDSKPTY